jgi:molecular chaperone HtpG
MVSEDKFYDKAKDFVLVTNTKKENFTLTEYKDKVEAGTNR